MTNEEAIENISLLFQFEKINDYLNLTSRERIEFNNCIYEALEKQIPKKPIDSKEQECSDFDAIWWVKTGYCPCCREDIDDETTRCEPCGQKLDWSE